MLAFLCCPGVVMVVNSMGIRGPWGGAESAWLGCTSLPSLYPFVRRQSLLACSNFLGSLQTIYIRGSDMG